MANRESLVGQRWSVAVKGSTRVSASMAERRGWVFRYWYDEGLTPRADTRAAEKYVNLNR